MALRDVTKEQAALGIALAMAVLGLVGLAATQFTPWKAPPELLPIWCSFVLYLPARTLDRRWAAKREQRDTPCEEPAEP